MLYPILATVSLALQWTGFALRARGAARHAMLMGTGLVIDLGLLLTLEFTRNAIGTVAGGSLGTYQKAHVAASSVAVLFYLPVIVFGAIRLRAPSEANVGLRHWHRRLGYCALACRTVGYAFMFSMLGN